MKLNRENTTDTRGNEKPRPTDRVPAGEPHFISVRSRSLREDSRERTRERGLAREDSREKHRTLEHVEAEMRNCTDDDRTRGV